MELVRTLAWALLSAATLTHTGCEQPNIGVVTGQVVVDGEPAPNGSIAFFPLEGQSFTAGSEIVDGRYRARVPVGSSRVEIRVSKIVGEHKLYDTADSPVQPVMEEMLPPRYNAASELKIDVVAGANEYDFELTTK